jgi:putative two-component system response regulator
MRAHPDIGARIVEPIRFLADAVQIVRSHHERWDGRGYPDGLAEERIPMAARIFAVVDSFDAMTYDRPYRRAMTPERAFEQIREGSGTQFDPSVAAAFLEMMDT